MYFKILNEDETHNGFHYREGLNEDVIPFNSEPDCKEGGLYFADENSVFEFLNYGVYVREVTLPEGEEIVRVETKYKAHRIILGKRLDLRDVETWKWLLAHGADVHASDDYALYWASLNGRTDVVRLLLDNGADVHANDDGALYRASYYGHTDVVRLLLDHGADVHANNDGALRWASANGHTDVVRLLLDRGANVHAYNNDALSWASKNGHTDVVRLLLDRGANVHAYNNDALSWASKNGHTDVVAILEEHMKKDK